MKLLGGTVTTNDSESIAKSIRSTKSFTYFFLKCLVSSEMKLEPSRPPQTYFYSMAVAWYGDIVSGK